MSCFREFSLPFPDARGLATLVRNKTLPSVWIPPGDLRDKRELPRMRIAFARMKTMLKNRIHATLAKYAIKIEEVTDVFTGKGRIILKERIQDLPPQTRKSVIVQLKLLDQVVKQIQWNEGQIEKIIEKTPEMKLLMTIPGVGTDSGRRDCHGNR